MPVPGLRGVGYTARPGPRVMEQPAHETSGTRSLRRSARIAAAQEAVWNALTEPRELCCWLPLQAEVDPRPGGRIWMDCGEGGREGRIQVWEPPHRLRVTYEHPASGARPLRLAEDYRLHGEGEDTRLEVTQEGFCEDDAGRAHLASCARGWDLELACLRHYLERHRGRRRTVVRAAAELAGSAEHAWGAVMGPAGLRFAGEPPGEGRSFSVDTAREDQLAGRVVLCRPPHDFAAVVENLSGAFLCIRCEELGPGRDACSVSLWLSLYDVPHPTVGLLRRSFERLVRDLG